MVSEVAPGGASASAVFRVLPFFLGLAFVAMPLQGAPERLKTFEFQSDKYSSLADAEARMRELSGVYGPYMEPVGDQIPYWGGSKWVYRYSAATLEPELETPTWYNAGFGCGPGMCLDARIALEVYFNNFKEDYCTRNLRQQTDWQGPFLVSGSLYPTLHIQYSKRYQYEEARKTASGDCGASWAERILDASRNTPISCPEGYEVRMKDDWFECIPKSRTQKSIFVNEVPGCCKTALHGNPVDLVRGGKQHTETVYSSGWIPYTLNYNSRGNFGGLGQFGAGWIDNFSMRIFPAYNGYVNGIVRPDGSFLKVNYIPHFGRYEVHGADGLTLLRDGSQWKIRKSGNETEVYDNAGMLLRVERIGRPNLHFTRDTLKRIVRIEDDLGRTLELVRGAHGRLEKLVNAEGHEVAFGYGPAWRLESIEYPDGAEKRFLYEDLKHRNFMTGIVDENGDRFATYAYDKEGRVVSSERAGGHETVDVTYHADGNVSVQEVTGNVVTYSFAAFSDNWLPIAADTPCAGNCSFSYQSASYSGRGYRYLTVDFNGHATHTSINVKGQPFQKIDAKGTALERKTTTDWHGTLNVPTRVTEPGRITDYSYDDNGNRLSETVTDTATGRSRTTSWTYNRMGLLETVDGPRTDVNDVTRYGYDGYGNLASVTNALGHVTHYTRHDVHGNPLEIIDPNGIVTELEYDLRQRLIRRTVAAGTAAAATTRFGCRAADPHHLAKRCLDRLRIRRGPSHDGGCRQCW